MTGSHNLGFKASSKNDDNLMIVEGNAPLAAAYAVNIIAIYQTYRWNAYVEAHRQDPKVWHGLVDNDAWQSSHLAGDDLAEIQFWLGTHPAAAGPSAATPPAGPPAHTASASGPAPGGRPATAQPQRGATGKKAPASRKAPAKKNAAAKKKAPAKRAAAHAKRKAPAKHRSTGRPGKNK
jgi:hypothetical protein